MFWNKKSIYGKVKKTTSRSELVYTDYDLYDLRESIPKGKTYREYWSGNAIWGDVLSRVNDPKRFTEKAFIELLVNVLNEHSNRIDILEKEIKNFRKTSPNNKNE